MHLDRIKEDFDVILASNLLCRLRDPSAFFSLLPNLVIPGGQLILTSPYSWLEKYTPRTEWLVGSDGKSCLEYIQNILRSSFDLVSSFDMPFLMREHLRKYQWIIAEASLWRRKLNS